MNKWEMDKLNEQFEDCQSPSYNRFYGPLTYELAEELDLLVDKLVPVVMEEFMNSDESWDSLIECLKKNPKHKQELDSYPDGVDREDVLKDAALRDFITNAMIPVAENVARCRIRMA